MKNTKQEIGVEGRLMQAEICRQQSDEGQLSGRTAKTDGPSKLDLSRIGTKININKTKIMQISRIEETTIRIIINRER